MAASEKSGAACAAEQRHGVRPGRIGAITDDAVSFRPSHIQHRRAVHIDAERREIRRNQPCIQPDRLYRVSLVRRGDTAEHVCRRSGSPERRLQPLYPAAFLIDQHKGVGAPDTFAQVGNERPCAVRVRAIPGEQDESEGIDFGE